MVNFVICEDEKIFLKRFENIISKSMMIYDVDYKIHVFDGYGEQFEKYVKESADFNIYLMDIKTNEGTGINAARMIREKYGDWASMIIIITSYAEYKYEALSTRLMLVDFINKLDKCEEGLSNAIQIALKNYDDRPNMLTYEYHKMMNRINFKDIVLIEKEPDSKRCIVHTNEQKYIVPKTLNKIEEMLDKRFLKVHRSAIINMDHLKKIDMIRNKMIFKNGAHSYLLSRSKKKELLEYVGKSN